MTSTIITKNSSTASGVPLAADLTQGELAVNVTDKKLYSKDSGGSVVKLVGSLGNQEANAVAITGGAVNGTTIGATTAAAVSATTLSASGTVSGTGFSNYLASPPAIGGTTAAAGSFTTLTTSSTVTLNGGTANGVTYLNGSKVLTSGSALTFDGTNLGLGVTPSAWNSAFKSFSFARAGSTLYALTGSNLTGVTANAIYDSADWKYVTSDYATRYQQNSGAHAWHTAASGTAGNAISFTQAMTLEASGNLLVGRTSAITSLSTGSQAVSISASASNRVGILELNGTRTADGNDCGYVRFFNNAGATPVADITAFRGSTDTTGTLTFSTSNSERARITSGGYFKASNTASYYLATGAYHELQSSTSDTQNTTFSHSAASPYGVVVRYTGASPNNTDNWFLYCDDSGGTQRASIKSNGGLYNYQANNSNLSDRREKTNFAPAKSYLDVICSIPVQTFNYIDQNLEQDGGLTLGVVAQDVQAVAPELVTESNWGTNEEPKMRLSIYQTDLQYALMKALQELKAEFDAYKASHP